MGFSAASFDDLQREQTGNAPAKRSEVPTKVRLKAPGKMPNGIFPKIKKAACGHPCDGMPRAAGPAITFFGFGSMLVRIFCFPEMML